MGERFFGLRRWTQTNKNFVGLVFKRRAGRGVTQHRLLLGECWCQFQRSNARLSGVGGRTQAGEGWRALSTAQRKEAVRLALEKEREKARKKKAEVAEARPAQDPFATRSVLASALTRHRSSPGHSKSSLWATAGGKGA